MKFYRKELIFDTTHRREFINITPSVEAYLHESNIKEGLLLCNAMHITASVFINDDKMGCTTTMKCGSKSWRQKDHIHNAITTALKTMPMPT